MKIVASTGREDVAVVYIVEYPDGKLLECVESIQPPLPREEKWVLLISTMFGCPVGCAMCDAGGHYEGKFPPNRSSPSSTSWCLNVSRIGASHPASSRSSSRAWASRLSTPPYLRCSKRFQLAIKPPALMPSLSTIAPACAAPFFDRLLEIKRRRYSGGHFQFQFSLHTTDQALRDQIIPVKKWSFRPDGRLWGAFLPARRPQDHPQLCPGAGQPARCHTSCSNISPRKNSWSRSPRSTRPIAPVKTGWPSYIDPCQPDEQDRLVEALRQAGYEVILSIGEVEENAIGSNCGQYLRRHMNATELLENGILLRGQEGGGRSGSSRQLAVISRSNPGPIMPEKHPFSRSSVNYQG